MVFPRAVRLLCLILALALVAACGDRDGDPAPGPAPEETPSATETAEEDAAPPVSLVKPPPPTPVVEISSEKKIEIELLDTPPTKDPVESGTYVLSVSIELDNGGSVNDRHACTVEVEGEKITLRMDRSKGDPFTGTLKDGRLEIEAREGEATYGLKGQVVGPGRLRGTVVAGAGLEGVKIIDGRWSLDRVK